MPKPYWDIFKELAKIGKERGKYYGEATENMADTCKILKEAFGITLAPHQLALVMVAVKLSREKNRHKKDNLIDAANYIAISLACKEKYGKQL